MSTTTSLVRVTAVLAMCFAAIEAAPAWAFQFETGDPSLQLRWDNTLQYSVLYRVSGQSPKLVSCPTCGNFDDGDRNFDTGVASNRLSLLSEFDFRKSFSDSSSLGVRVSGDGWYDSVYNRPNDNNSPKTVNAFSVPPGEFTKETRRIMGHSAELLDAFLFGRTRLGNIPVTVRLGRHALSYGETLFFGQNGIADAQQPIDAIKLTSVPNTQFKELILPVWQASTIVQLTDKWSVGGYYQFQWRETHLPASGSFLSPNDFLGNGAERVFAGPPLTPTSGPRQWIAGPNLNPKSTGQFGLQLRYSPQSYDLGLYFAQYGAKTPWIYFVQTKNADPLGTGVLGQLVHVFPEDIRTAGVSISTNLDPLNIASEISYRWNTPLVSDGQVIARGRFANNSDHPAYAVGRTLHANLSATYLLPPSLLWEGGSFLSEVAWNMRTAIDENPKAMDPNTTKSAMATRFVFSPAYFQVLPNTDLNIPIGLGYNPFGRSSAVQNFNGGVDHGGDVTFGLGLVYKASWFFNFRFVDRFGPSGPVTEVVSGKGPIPVLSFKQTLADRKFVSIDFSHTF
ncbi:MAG: DUF1302 family protein [Gammaproteobacteria bacterium]|nr:DUF1302 family protein [Gammaproteobacteria bacterium]